MLAAASAGVRTIVGDAELPATLYAAHAEAARSIIVCVAPDLVSIGVVRRARAVAPVASIGVSVQEAGSEQSAREAGADTVVDPHRLAGRLAAQFIIDSGPERQP